jgi:hypothetical protein
MKREASAILGAGILALGLGLAGATPASAQPRGHCYSASCNGQDPEQTGCAVDTADNQTWTSPATLLQSASGTAWLVLRYSPLCNSNWATLSYNPGFPSHSIWVQNQNGNISYFSNQAGGPGGGTVWSAMVDGSVPAWACADFWILNGTQLESGCTGTY